MGNDNNSFEHFQNLLKQKQNGNNMVVKNTVKNMTGYQKDSKNPVLLKENRIQYTDFSEENNKG